jgi:hypothetical protein
MEAFRTSLQELGVTQPSTNARTLYPFACTALRCYRALKRGEYHELISQPKQQSFQYKPAVDIRGAAAVVGKASVETKSKISSRNEAETTERSDIDGDDDTEGGGIRSSTTTSTTTSTTASRSLKSASSFGPSYMSEDLQLGRLLAACRAVDVEAERQHSLTDAADEVLVSMRRCVLFHDDRDGVTLYSSLLTDVEYPRR